MYCVCTRTYQTEIEAVKNKQKALFPQHLSLMAGFDVHFQVQATFDLDLSSPLVILFSFFIGLFQRNIPARLLTLGLLVLHICVKQFTYAYIHRTPHFTVH